MRRRGLSSVAQGDSFLPQDRIHTFKRRQKDTGLSNCTVHEEVRYLEVEVKKKFYGKRQRRYRCRTEEEKENRLTRGGTKKRKKC